MGFMKTHELTQSINTSVVITDIRNFTGLFHHFQERNDSRFLNFMRAYKRLHMRIAEMISPNYYVNSTGDGIVVIFMSEDHHLNAYVFGLMIHKKLNELCERFNTKNNVFVDFGIGMDSGNVWKISESHEDKNMNTYLGAVINRTTRIEAHTKIYHGINMLIGEHIFKKLVKDLYPDLFEEVANFKQNYELTITDDSLFIRTCKQLMLFYISDVVIRGLKQPIPLFKVVPYYVHDNDIFWKVVQKIIGKDKTDKLKSV